MVLVSRRYRLPFFVTSSQAFAFASGGSGLPVGL